MDANKHDEITSAFEQIRELKAENERLKSLLAKHGITLEENKCPAIALQPYNKPVPNCKLSLKDKVLLFQSLFKGRNDVFAKRWHSLTGKAGYQRPYANGNGTDNIATNANIAVPTAPTVFLHL